MGKKIGKSRVKIVLFGLLMIPVLQAEPSIQLSVTDANGDQLEQAQVNVPFRVNVTVSNDINNLPNPTLKGIEQFSIQGTGTQMSTVIQNGVKEVSKTTQINVVSNQQGEFTLGPAVIESNGKQVESAIFKIVVAEKQKVKNVEDDQPFVQLSFDKDRVYFGQEVQFIMRFYYVQNNARLSQIQQPVFDNFTGSKLSEPQSGTKTVNGKQYRYLEWKAQLYPQQIGELKIPALGAEYSVPSKRSRGMFGDISDMFGGMRSIKRVYSNEPVLEVMPLPDDSKQVQAVGQFSSIESVLNNNNATQGEGVVLVLNVFGTGNIEQLQHPGLKLPDNITFYESGMKIEQEGNQFRKSFEYILQGRAPGKYEIPTQEFTFFNPQKEMYQTLLSNSLELIIHPGQNTAPQGVENSEDSFNKKEQEEKLLPVVLEEGAWKMPRTRTFSMVWFVVLLLIPLFGWFIIFLQKRRKQYLERNAPLLRYNNAFNVARSEIGKARKAGHDARLYHIIIELFGARLKLIRSEVSEQLIEKTLTKKGLSHSKLIEWRLFFAHLTENAFSSYGTVERNDKLFNQAIHWLYELEKLV
jgi:hypothetical protein